MIPKGFAEKGFSKADAESIMTGKDQEAEPEQSAAADLSRLEIEPADNGGFTVTHHLKPKKTKSKGKEGEVTSHDEYQEPMKHVFSTHEQMMTHLMKALKSK